MHLDEALERVLRLREQLLADPFAEARAERLALLFESEARAWSQLFELTRLRPVWRAALAAELVARQQATQWRERAAVERAMRAHRPEDVCDIRLLAHIGQG